eukprot:TRINITY_DN5294_c0_g1_i1.p1 TRINITY_DN5294_c0_g1~~TRINITY_DN5294_c0_g1_i1.p1  ORF type:complete len:176 (+),score=27.54 TRINITY_DN5294_c0_g1_i1:304-831(+)
MELKNFIHYLEEDNFDYATGINLDQVRFDGDIISVESYTPILTQFSRTCRFSHNLFHNEEHKIPVYKGNIRSDNGNHYISKKETFKLCLSNLFSGFTNFCYDNIFFFSKKQLYGTITIHHVKWASDVFEKYNQRAKEFKEKGLNSFVHHENIIGYLFSNNCTISRSDLNKYCYVF